ncbi:hypothetical protein M3Y98_01086200 [Aphelenchoides besseyi]|nr:hypothetical protein M3Y98_01086200 [Aphelenchoides besseyi]KAI6209459.1 hypothetical protein M3Y96_00223600 [Aphelenchoides besseyi]
MKISKSVVPYTECEWKFVKTNVMCQDSSVLEEVLAILQMWESRLGNDTPIIIVLTRHITEAIVYDLKNCSTNDGFFNQPTAIALYSLAVIRFVNHLNEIGQPKIGFLVSVFDAVRDLGIPDWLVQLRHNAVHGELPTFRELRNGVEFCRKWLVDVLWSQPMSISIADPLIKTEPRASSPIETLPDPRFLLRNFWSYVTNPTKDATEKKALQRKCVDAIKRFRHVIRLHEQVAVESFYDVCLLPLSNAELETPKMRRILGADFKLKRITRLPPRLARLWCKIIDQFVRYHAMGSLIRLFTERTLDLNLSFLIRIQLAAWTRHFVRRMKSNDTQLLQPDLNQIAINVINGMVFEQTDLENVLELFKNNDAKCNFYREMWNVKRNSTPNNVVLNDKYSTGLTVEDLKLRLQQSREMKLSVKCEDESWTLVQLSTPLGLTENQSAETLELSSVALPSDCT